MFFTIDIVKCKRYWTIHIYTCLRHIINNLFSGSIVSIKSLVRFTAELYCPSFLYSTLVMSRENKYSHKGRSSHAEEYVEKGSGKICKFFFRAINWKKWEQRLYKNVLTLYSVNCEFFYRFAEKGKWNCLSWKFNSNTGKSIVSKFLQQFHNPCLEYLLRFLKNSVEKCPGGTDLNGI